MRDGKNRSEGPRRPGVLATRGPPDGQGTFGNPAIIWPRAPEIPPPPGCPNITDVSRARILPRRWGLFCGAARAASYLDALTRASKTPGSQYVVVNANRVVFEYTGGWADIRRQVPVDAATTMMAYSMSKTITAVAALQLVEAGKVGLDDSVGGYVDSWPYGAGVTIRQLISHTSGIPNPLPLRWVHPAARQASFDENGALAAVLHDHPRLSFELGTRYAYSNIGYWLLGKVVERASGVCGGGSRSSRDRIS
jgi:CubicO group peptidase (beta-lactamase class C family)